MRRSDVVRWCGPHISYILLNGWSRLALNNVSIERQSTSDQIQRLFPSSPARRPSLPLVQFRNERRLIIVIAVVHFVKQRHFFHSLPQPQPQPQPQPDPSVSFSFSPCPNCCGRGQRSAIILNRKRNGATDDSFAVFFLPMNQNIALIFQLNMHYLTQFVVFREPTIDLSAYRCFVFANKFI